MSDNIAQRPIVLSIAGHDPSAGAGLSADIKSIEKAGSYAMSICSAITVQNDQDFEKLYWASKELLSEQITCLQKRFSFAAVKVGLIESLESLSALVSLLQQQSPEPKIVWDPILKASAGFTFHSTIDRKNIELLLPSLQLITPNIPELKVLTGMDDIAIAAGYLSAFAPLLLKGGHEEGHLVTDRLFVDGVMVKEYSSPRLPGPGKHGSGCVLSSAISAKLAQGKTLVEAIREAKEQQQNFMQSTESLLGLHS